MRRSLSIGRKVKDPNLMSDKGSLVDSFGRVAAKLRISVTDRCNFQCNFCMPVHPVWLPHDEILSFEEITRLSTIFAKMGINKIRLSGGEPTMRKDVEKLVRMLVGVPGIESVNMTTNGFQLVDKAAVLKENGLRGVTVSLHTLKSDRFDEITATRNNFDRVLDGIKKAKEVGLKMKINCVVIKGYNKDEIIDLARLAYEEEITMRFIEFMPFDGKRLWGFERVFGGAGIVKEISREYPLSKLSREHGSTAEIYAFTGESKGKIGVITSITAPFCGDCDRVRLKADGKVVPCLFGSEEFDIRPLLRRGDSDKKLEKFVKKSFFQKSSGVETMLKEQVPLMHIRPMHTIGG